MGSTLRNTPTGLAILALLALAVSSPRAQAAPSLRCVADALRERFSEPRRMPFDSSVELELRATPAVLNMFTTRNGKVGPLFSDAGIVFDKKMEVPDKIRSYLRSRGIEDPRKLLTLAWDPIPADVKVELIRWAAGKQSFFGDRKIHGLRLKRTLRMNFIGPTRFLGKLYPAGQHEVVVSKAFLPYVEFSDPSKFDVSPGVEIHLRRRTNAGENSRDAWIFEQGRGVKKSHQHVHLVAKIPYEALKANPMTMPAQLADYLRRGNLLADMVAVIEGAVIQDQKVNNNYGVYTAFGTVTSDGLAGFENDVNGIANGRQNQIFSDNKISLLASRRTATYGESDALGFEYRAIPSTARPEVISAVLDRIQRGLIDNDYGVPEKRMKRWLKKNQGIRNPVSREWYIHYSYAGPLYDRLAEVIGPNEVGARIDRDRSLLIAIHDWSNDPLFFDSPKAKQRIADAQEDFFRKLGRLQKESAPISEDEQLADELDLLKQFFRDSGILEKTLESFGLRKRLMPLLGGGP